MRSPEPPAIAQVLLEFFVPARGREGVIGDLVEEYRDAQVPARGEAGADWWYVRQTLGFLWPCLTWGLLVSAVMIARDLYDLARPTTDFHTRAEVTTYACVLLFALGGLFAAWRSHRALSGAALGAIVGLMTCAIAVLYALTAGQLLLHTAAAANPEAYAALVETADIPIVPIMIIGIVTGTIGGLAGKLIGSRGSRGAVRS